MSEAEIQLTLLAAIVAAVAMLSLAFLKAWNGWLELRRIELGGGGGRPARAAPPRLELADLKDRVRRLEAIANGVEH
jgi:hypothetical protein